MGIVSLPSFGSDPVTITAAGLDGKVDPLATEFNGSIDNDNIKAAAGIVYSKLTLTGGVVYADISATAFAAVTQNFVMSGKILKFAKGADVASAAGAITLGDDGNVFDITGTAAITSITAKTAGTVVILQFDSTASLVDGSNLALAGNFTGAAGSVIMLASDGTNWMEVSRQPNTYTPSVTNALAGSVIQVVNAQVSTVATGTTTIPIDDSIPQSGEGTEFTTLAITPTHADNKLLISFTGMFASSDASAAIVVALFQDATANALAATIAHAVPTVANNTFPVTIQYYMTAGTTSATTFKIRAGGSAASTITFGGFGGARKLGAIPFSSLTIQEIKV